MNIFLKKTILQGLAITLFLGTYLPTRFQAQAQTLEEPFGGQNYFVLGPEICNCPPVATNIHFVFDYNTETLLKLYKAPTSKIYENNDLDTGLYQVGTYIPLGPNCMAAGDPCTFVTNANGTYGDLPGTGVSLLETTGQLFANAASPFVKNTL